MRELSRGCSDRNYEARPGELPGRADVVGLEDAETVVVLDYKSGWRYLGEAVDSLQLLLYALMAARACGARSGPRWGSSASPRTAVGRTRFGLASNEFDLDAAGERVSEVMQALEEHRGGEARVAAAGPGQPLQSTGLMRSANARRSARAVVDGGRARDSRRS